MSKKRKVNANASYNVQKCKRIVRPLISKLHSFNDLCVKYPSILDTHFPFDVIDRFMTLRTSGLNCRQTSPGEHEGPNDEVYFSESEKAPFRYLKNLGGHISNPEAQSFKNTFKKLQKLREPRNSFERLASLKPFISNETFHAYDELFLIFRTIITSLVDTRDISVPSGVSKLSTAASIELGKNAALYTKSTYYKLNQSFLFDSDTLPQEYRQLSATLSDDIDEWLNLDPKTITCHYRTHILIGYVIHLLVLHLRSTISLLMPVLLSWLQEEYKTSLNPELVLMKRIMFNGFWMGVDSSVDKLGFDSNQSRIIEDKNITVFWSLLKLDYWKFLFYQLGVINALDKNSCYEKIMLQGLLTQNNFSFLIIRILEFDSDSFLSCEIRNILQSSSDHTISGNLVVLIVTQIIRYFRKAVTTLEDLEKIHEVIVYSYDTSCALCQIWLHIASDLTQIFELKFPGNFEIFDAFFGLLDFLEDTAKKLFFILKNGVATKKGNNNYFYDFQLIGRIQQILSKCKSLNASLGLMRAYLLEIPFDPPLEMSMNLVSQSLLSFFGLENGSRFKGVKENEPLNRFLHWLTKRNAACMQLAKTCSEKYYGVKYSRVYDVFKGQGDSFQEMRPSSTSSNDFFDSKLDSSIYMESDDTLEGSPFF